MSLPSSGQISVKQIFDEATGGGCYEGGSGYSLGALADAFGIPSNPDAMSEFYGLSCPAVSYDVDIYSSAGDLLSGPQYNVYYSEDGFTWNYLAGPLSSTICAKLPTVSISSGIIYVRAERDGTSTPVYIVGTNSSSCPGNLADTCEYSTTVSSNMSIAITVAVSGGDFFDCF